MARPYDRGGGARDPALDVHDCSDFAEEAEAQAAFLRAGGPGRDDDDLDQDGDGNACEYDPRQDYLPMGATATPGPECRQVAGYRRKDGALVSGHVRCR